MMNIRVIQPPYPKRVEDTPASVAFMIDQLRLCDESLDLILLPECCNAPSGCGDSSLLRRLVAEHTEQLLTAVKETAIRCKSVVGINLYVYGQDHETKVRNATLLFDSKGNLAAQYDKQHLPVSEYTNDFIDHSYLNSKANPFCAEVDGVRYAFLTCYDMYYTEFIHRISLEKPDVVLICSLQRAERGDILEMQGKNCAFVCNSYVVRSSYHMGYDSKTGGCSMIVAPDGLVIRNFGQEKGSFDCQVENVHYKYCRSNGFGQPEVTNNVYQALFRTPWCYRVGGSGVVPNNARMEFPRISAVRGFTAAAPENTVAGIGLAVAMGASEVQFDVRRTADGVPVLSRDADVAHLTGQSGLIRQMNCAELLNLNPGKQFGSCYDGVRYATVEDIFAAFPQRTIFNLHIAAEPDGNYDSLIQRILELAEHYDCAEHFYFSSEDPAALRAAAALAPAVERCLVQNSVDTATELGCTRIQATAAYLSDDVIAQAKAANIRCNLVMNEKIEQAEGWFVKGVDCILANNFLNIKNSH